MFFFKKLILFSFIFFNISCSLNNFQEIQNLNDYSVEVETPIDKYNIYLKENLRRLFFNKNNVTKKYILQTTITFQSTETLSVSGNDVLKSTKAQISYQLKNKEKNTVLETGSINTFPALSSSSNSLYSQEKSIEHIKERLTKSSAKSLYMHINILIRRLR